MKRIYLSLIVASLLSACASEPPKTQASVPVEDRTQTSKPHAAVRRYPATGAADPIHEPAQGSEQHPLQAQRVLRL